MRSIEGRLAVIQPLLVTTIVFALSLGWLLTNQHVGRREVGGAAVIVIGLGMFALFGDPAGGKENAGILFGLSAALTKPTVELLHATVGASSDGDEAGGR